MLLTDNISVLKNVGEQRQAILGRLGIETIGDLLEFFPRDYLDRSKISKVAGLYHGQMVTVLVWQHGIVATRNVSGKTITRINFCDDTGRVAITWFNQPYMSTSFKAGEKYYISGRVSWDAHGVSIENPEWERVGDANLSAGRIVPVYRLTSGLTQKIIRPIIKQALDSIKDQIEEFLPEKIITSQGLCGRSFAVENIHFPSSAENYFTARKRLVFDELFLMQSAMFMAKGQLKHKILEDNKWDYMDINPILAALPFELTPDQLKVVQEITADISSGYALNRLLQGDVGSGKTAVAMIICYLAVKNKTQAAVMAPTETLAVQHHQAFTKIFEPFGINCALLNGSLKASEKKNIKNRLEAGEIDIIIGTHALLQENVTFSKLGLVITDEQHRFGVRQRAALTEKGSIPHTLVMTATPIPRSLAMVLYGDMDISAIRQLPPGRQPIDTYSVTKSYHQRIFSFIAKEIDQGHQAYIICPLIQKDDDENEKKTQSKNEITQVIKFAQELKDSVFTNYNVGILHGKMKPAEKNEIMEAFAKNDVQILVSTTVVEVGINVPNATVIMIENAERFGLSQLHQLRGRVGRSEKKSYCILVTDAKNEVTQKRMQAMTKTNDGFALSELDLELRGPGEFFGTAQHGLPRMQLANLYKDTDVLAAARDAAIKTFDGQQPSYAPLLNKVKQMLGKIKQISL